MRWTYVTSTEESPSQAQAATVGSWGSIRDGREGAHPYFFPYLFPQLMPSFDNMSEIWGLRAGEERGIGKREDQRCFQNGIRLRGEIKRNVASWLRV